MNCAQASAKTAAHSGERCSGSGNSFPWARSSDLDPKLPRDTDLTYQIKRKKEQVVKKNTANGMSTEGSTSVSTNWPYSSRTKGSFGG